MLRIDSGGPRAVLHPVRYGPRKCRSSAAIHSRVAFRAEGFPRRGPNAREQARWATQELRGRFTVPSDWIRTRAHAPWGSAGHSQPQLSNPGSGEGTPRAHMRRVPLHAARRAARDVTAPTTAGDLPRRPVLRTRTGSPELSETDRLGWVTRMCASVVEVFRGARFLPRKNPPSVGSPSGRPSGRR